MCHERWMRHAIDRAREGVAAAQTPFGACLVRDGRILACEHNVVWATTDITAHAEVHAIRAACRSLRTIDLSGSTMYSTCEPCPMCFAACHWAKIASVVYGASIADAREAGFSELAISSDEMRRFGQSAIEVIGGVLRAEAIELFNEWRERPDCRAY